MNSELTIYKVGRALRQDWRLPGIGSLFAEGTYAHTYRQGIPYENARAPFFLFTEKQAALAFLHRVQERFPSTTRLALWRGTAAECWECPSHAYLGYKRDRWPSFWRAYQAMRGGQRDSARTSAEHFFSAVASHPLASPVAAGTLLCPAFQLVDCLCVLRGAQGRTA